MSLKIQNRLNKNRNEFKKSNECPATYISRNRLNKNEIFLK